MTWLDIGAYASGVAAVVMFIALAGVSPEMAVLFALVWAALATFVFARR